MQPKVPADTVHALKPRNEETYCGRDARVSGGGVPYGFGIRGVSCEPCVDAAMATEPARELRMYTRYFSFGIGDTDPKTGEGLRNKYVTVIAPTAEGCRDAMLGSRFGRDWSMEYIPGRPNTEQWIPRWTDHARIVVDADVPSNTRCHKCSHVEHAHVIQGCAARGWEDPCRCSGFYADDGECE